MTISELISERIKNLCQEKGITPNKLGKLSGLDPSTITSIFYGKSKNPGVDTLSKIAKGLGITLQQFFDTPQFCELTDDEIL